MNPPILQRCLPLLALLAAMLFAPPTASAQLTRADTAAVLLAAARDFDTRGENDIASALFRHIADRFPGTAAAALARGHIQGVPTLKSRAGGEVEFKVWSTLYGIWQGIAVPVVADADSPEAYGLGLLLGGPLGFVLGREIARSRPLSLGQARAVTWGGTWGAIQGWGWARVLDLGGGRATHPGGTIPVEEAESTRAAIASMIVGGAAGIAGGLALARHDITPGTATSTMLGSLWGLWFGSSVGFLADLEGDGLIAASMIGGNAGLLVGAVAANRMSLSRSRARLISVGGVVGAFGGLGLTLIAQPDEEKSGVSIVLASSIAGLAIATAGTRGDRDESDESGDLASVASLPAPGALLNWSDGGWALSTPLPAPSLGAARQSGDGDGLVWKVPLLKVRF